jgi:hypothetical protein
MSAIDPTFTFSQASPAPALRLRFPALKLPALRLPHSRPRRPLAELVAPILILVLLLVAGLIWLAVGGAVMRGTR